jgi:predicted PurR-regulated permease PerM
MKASRAIKHIVRVELSKNTALIVLGCIAASWLFMKLWPIFLVVLVALMLVGMLNPAIDFLEPKVRRTFAISIVFLFGLVTVALFSGFMVPQFITEVSEIIDRMPAAQAQLATALEHFRFTSPLVQTLRGLRSAEFAGRFGALMLANSSKIIEVAAYAAASLSLALYLVVDRDRMRGVMYAVTPRHFHLRL